MSVVRRSSLALAGPARAAQRAAGRSPSRQDVSVTITPPGRDFGLARGKVFPADRAKSLLNPGRRLLQSPGRTVAAMGLAPDARVLEVGSGPGFFSPFIARAVPCGRLVLVDVQAGMLLAARARLGQFANVSLAQGDAGALPVGTGQFDAVLLATMLGEVPDRDRCIGEIRRVLRPGGFVTIAETRRDSDFIRFDSLRPLVERHQFSFVDRRGIPWQYVARFRSGTATRAALEDGPAATGG
jgi:ubiquinone/menaquinone biosynthesis C-methylase UbiE